MTTTIKRQLTILLLITVAIIAAGCATTKAWESKTYIKPAQAITQVKVLYLDHTLKSKNIPGYDPAVSTGYRDLPKLFQQRIPVIFGLNGISSAFIAVPPSRPLTVPEMQLIGFKENRSAPLLVIQIIDGNKSSRVGSTSGVTKFNFEADLYDHDSDAKIWSSHFTSQLTVSMVLHDHFNQEYVDNFLKTVLVQMANDGLIKLPDGSIVMPPVNDAAAAQTDADKDSEATVPPAVPYVHPITSHKSKTFNDIVTKIDVISNYGKSAPDVVTLDKALSSAISEALKNSCIKEINGIATANKGKDDAADQEPAFSLVVLPMFMKNADEHVQFSGFQMALHHITETERLPVHENMVWDAETFVFDTKVDKEQLRTTARQVVQAMIKNKVIPESCH
ncbi:MAG TPA: hypothetical protein VIE69_09685 [Methylophilaceae bacterium]